MSKSAKIVIVLVSIVTNGIVMATIAKNADHKGYRRGVIEGMVGLLTGNHTQELDDLIASEQAKEQAEQSKGEGK